MCSNVVIRKAILSGDVKTVKKLTSQWLSSGRSVQEFQENVSFPTVIQPGNNLPGRCFICRSCLSFYIPPRPC